MLVHDELRLCLPWIIKHRRLSAERPSDRGVSSGRRETCCDGRAVRVSKNKINNFARKSIY